MDANTEEVAKEFRFEGLDIKAKERQQPQRGDNNGESWEIEGELEERERGGRDGKREKGKSDGKKGATRERESDGIRERKKNGRKETETEKVRLGIRAAKN